MLGRLGVLGSGGRERRYIDLVCNDEGAMEPKPECLNEVSASALVASAWSRKSADYPPAYYSTNVPVSRNPDMPNFASVPRLVWSSWGVRQCQYLLNVRFMI